MLSPTRGKKSNPLVARRRKDPWENLRPRPCSGRASIQASVIRVPIPLAHSAPHVLSMSVTRYALRSCSCGHLEKGSRCPRLSPIRISLAFVASYPAHSLLKRR